MLLAATPYPRKWMVVSKYLVSLLMFVACTFIFWLETLLLPSLGGFNAPLTAVLFFIVSLFLSLYLPLYYKIGYDNMKYTFVVVIMATPILTGAFDQMPQLTQAFVTLTTTIAPPLLYTAFIVASLVLLAVSACLSMRFYERADLV